MRKPEELLERNQSRQSVCRVLQFCHSDNRIEEHHLEPYVLALRSLNNLSRVVEARDGGDYLIDSGEEKYAKIRSPDRERIQGILRITQEFEDRLNAIDFKNQ